MSNDNLSWSESDIFTISKETKGWINSSLYPAGTKIKVYYNGNYYSLIIGKETQFKKITRLQNFLNSLKNFLYGIKLKFGL